MRKKKLTITSQRIKLLFDEKGYKTQKQFSDDLIKKFKNSKYNTVRINKWFNREEDDKTENFQLDELIDLANFFDCSLDYLVGLENQKSLDIEIREIAKKIGISEESIECLKNEDNDYFKKTINYLVSNVIGRQVIHNINNYIYYLPITKNIAYEITDMNINSYKSKETIDYEDIDNIKIAKIVERLKRLKTSTNEYIENLYLAKEELEKQIRKQENNSKFNENELINLYSELDEVKNDIKKYEENKEWQKVMSV